MSWLRAPGETGWDDLASWEDVEPDATPSLWDEADQEERDRALELDEDQDFAGAFDGHTVTSDADPGL